MAERTTARGIVGNASGRRLDELDVDCAFVHAEPLGAPEQLPDRLPALVAIVARELVDVHADEAVAELRVETAAELKRVGHRLVAVLEARLYRLAEDHGQVLESLVADVAAGDVHPERQREPG